MKFFIVDAFSKKAFGGNPAGVVMVENGDFPSADIMMKTAAELRYSETVFIKQLEEKYYHLRYFTPTEEVDLCGHATIAAFKVIATQTKLNGEQEFKAKTLAGDIDINYDGKIVMMDMAAPIDIDENPDTTKLNRIIDGLGLDPEKDLAYSNGSETNMIAEIISTGLPDLMLPLKSKEILDSIKSDDEKLAVALDDFELISVHPFYLDDTSSELKVHCRNFAPNVGIPEEAATGTSNGALTRYFDKRGMIEKGKLNTFIQGEAMDRPSEIYTTITDKIRVGGNAFILAEGEIHI